MEKISDMPSLPILQQERQARGLTQDDLARLSDISIPTLRGLERGRGSIRSLMRVMKTLDLVWGWSRPEENPAVILAARRHKKGFSQADVAKRAGCSRQTLICLEKELSGSVSILISVLAVLGLRILLRQRASKGSGGLVPPKNAPAQDRVMTPPELATAVIAHFADQMTGSILDPARGNGAFFDNFPSHLERHWCEVSEGSDFLEWSQPVDWVVTNPPWSIIRSFSLHAMALATNIVWVAPITNLATKARLRDLDHHGFGIAELAFLETPKGWPQSGFQLCAAHIKKGYRGSWQVGQLAISK